MTCTRAPFDTLTDHLAQRSRGPSAAAAVRRFAAAGAPVGALADPLAVALACHDPSRPTDARRTVAALAALAPHDELAALTALVALRPGLRRLAARLVSCGTPLVDAEADVLAAAWEVLVTDDPSPGTEGCAARRVVARTWSRCRALQRRRQRAARCTPAGLVPAAALGTSDGSVPGGSGSAAADARRLLATARDARVLTDRQLAVVVATRLQGRSVAAVAADTGSTVTAVRRCRTRAEARLRTFAAASACRR
jgi:DNA-directed RNA polymerase specialized sigma24 family protein